MNRRCAYKATGQVQTFTRPLTDLTTLFRSGFEGAGVTQFAYDPFHRLSGITGHGVVYRKL